MTTTDNQINMPEAGANQTVSLATDAPVTFNFTMDDVESIELTDAGVLVFTFQEGQTLAIENYGELAASGQGQEITLSDGEVVNLEAVANTSTAAVVTADEVAMVEPAAGEDFSNLISKPANTNSNNTFEVVSGKTYVADFNAADVQNVERMDNGDLVLTFTDGTQTILVNFDTIESAQDIPELTLSDGSVIKVTDLLTVSLEELEEEIVEEEVAIIEENPAEETAEIDIVEVARVEPRAGESLAEELAAIEPAAGDAAAGPLGGSNNFGSSVLPIGLDPALAVGPIGPTELAFDRPEIQNAFFVEEPDLPPVVTFGGQGAAADGSARVYEDGTVFVPITATLQGDTPQILTVTVTGIDTSWVVETGADNGTYDPANGTWTITLPQGENYNGGLTFTPPADSDVDMTGLSVTASAASTIRNNTETDTTSGQIIVDAVADDINLDANAANGSVTQPTAVDIDAMLQDVDGSEVISEVTITNVPNGFSFNAGSDNGNGTWTIPVADLSNLTVSAPADYSGSVTFGVEVTNIETVTDTDFDFTNNENVTLDEFTIVYDTPPTVTFGGDDPAADGSAQVYEDGSVFVPITATLQGDTNQQLTVTVTGVPSDWTVTTGADNGTYANGTWTITLPANTNYDGGLTFAPPADSDVDLDGLTVTATATNLDTNEDRSSSTDGEVLVDAVADDINLDTNDTAGLVNQPTPIDLSASLQDTDGSEEITEVLITDVPNGFSFNIGNDNGDGTWTVPVDQLSNLTVSSPADYSGSVTFGVQVTNEEENLNGEEFDLTNNENVTTGEFTVSYDSPPTVTFGGDDPAADGSAQVYEDGSVFVPITATLQGDTNQQLTVTLTGVPASWTVTTGADNGTYANGTWTITLPANTNYDGGLTFAPPADSDVDLDGLTVTATATNLDTNEDRSSSTDGEVIVDAVADQPDVNAGADVTVEAGASVALNITTGLNDTDGSESLGPVTISGVPNGYSLSAGNNNGNGTWVVERADLNGLMLNTPDDGQGSVELTVSVTSTEAVTDEEFDFTNNEATNTDRIVVMVDPDDEPVLTDSDDVVVDESDLDPTDDASSTITANFGNDTPGTYTVTGEDSFTFTGAEGGELTSNGTTVVVEVSGNSYVGTANGEEIFRLDLNETNGNYEFTLSGTLDHADENDPDDVIELQFGVTAEDSDGDTDSGFITIDVKDDAPVAKDDCNEFEVAAENKDYNISLILDVSGSMSADNGNEIADLKASVSNLLNDFGTYGNGQVKVFIQPFATNAQGSQSFTVTNAAELQAALNFVADLQANGGTNYEAPLQETIEWFQGNEPISGADNYTYFVSDGNPTRYQGNNGNSVLVGEENADIVMGEISGSDGTNEIGMIQNLSTVIGVGIGLDSEALARLSQIDTYGQAIDVQDSGNDLDAAFQNSNPLNGSASGNVITGENSSIPGADDLSEDVDNTVTAVSFNGNTVAVDPNNGATIEGQYGILQINADGSYTYNVTANGNAGDIVDTFEYVLTDGDGDSSTAELKLKGDYTANDQPPSVTFGGADGAAQGSAEVYEDGSVFVPITATLRGDTSQTLTVTLTGVPSSWTVQTGANNGSYSNGTWTITMPANENYDGGLTFTPPADSDVDLDDLVVTATATNTETDNEETSSTNGEIIVDAVADQPDLDAGDKIETTYGSSVDLDISASLNDTDGSEVLSVVTISGVPEGYSLSAGKEVSNGVWEVSKNSLDGLKLNVPDAPNGGVDSCRLDPNSSLAAGNNNTIEKDGIKLEAFERSSGNPLDFTWVQIHGFAGGLGVAGHQTDKILRDEEVRITFDNPADRVEIDLGDVGENNVNGGIDFQVYLEGQSSPVYVEYRLPSTVPVNGEATATFNSSDFNGAKITKIVSYSVAGQGEYPMASHTINDVRCTTFIEDCDIKLDVSVTATEKVTDEDFDLSNNQATANDSIHVCVKPSGNGEYNDKPVAKNDVAIMYSCDYATIGNVLTNYNQANDGTDILSKDGANKVAAVLFEGVRYSLPENGGKSIIVNGEHGSLHMSENGSYTYVSSTASVPKQSQSEVFAYELVDGNGDVSRASLKINVVEVDETLSDVADYGNQLQGPNYTIDGMKGYITDIQDGAMVYGFEEEDVLAGGQGDDTLFGWIGDDRLYGGLGNDYLQGEQGSNFLKGGQGADTFEIYSDKANNRIFDTVDDFDPNEGDVISLHNIISGFDEKTDDIGDFVQIVDTGSGTTIKVNADGQGDDFYNAVRLNAHADIDLDALDVYDLYAKGNIEV